MFFEHFSTVQISCGVILSPVRRHKERHQHRGHIAQPDLQADELVWGAFENLCHIPEIPRSVIKVPSGSDLPCKISHFVFLLKIVSQSEIDVYEC